MRTFICLFLLTWLLGIVLAVNAVDIRLSILISGIILAGLTFKGFKYQYIVVALFLIIAGSVWGQASLVETALKTECLSEQISQVNIDKVVRIEGDSAQYIVNTTTGCRVLLTTVPWPIYGGGSTLHLVGEFQSVLTTEKEYPEYAKYLISQGISSTIFYPEIAVMEVKYSLQNTIIQKLRSKTGEIFPEPLSGLVLTMTLAQKGSLPDEIVNQFRRTGTSHVLAISGLHMSLLAGMLLAVSLLVPLSPLQRSLTVIILLWGYVFLIGFPISAMRAVLFWTFFLLALRFGWLVSLPTVALLAATTLASFNPLIIQEVGFQLSLSAVVGIGLILFLVKGLPHYHMLSSSNTILEVVMISLGASLATAPLVLYHFGQISLISILGNLFVVPLVPIFLLLAIVSLLSSFVVPLLSIMISFVVHLIWQWWNTFTFYIGSIPGAYFDDVSISLWTVYLYYLIILIISHFIIKKQNRSWREIWQ